MVTRHVIAVAWVLFAAAGASLAFDAGELADDSDGKNWPAYGRTYGEQRYSPLKQINAGNIGGLGARLVAPSTR